MKAFEILIDNFWIIKEINPELYNTIKDASPKFKGFVEEKLGYKLIINTYAIKLEKLPGKAESWMGIQDFASRMEYGFFCILLMFLEDRGPGEQFVLSQAAEFIQSSWPGSEKVDWTLYRHRKCMVRILNFAAEMGLIAVNDGDEMKFSEAQDTEVLYESTGLSRYFVRNFTGNILNYSSYRDIGVWGDCGTQPVQPFKHARGDTAGLHKNSPREGAQGIKSHSQACVQKCDDADCHHSRSFRSRSHRRRRDLRDDICHPGDGAVILLIDYGKGLSDHHGNSGNRSCPYLVR